MKQNAVPPSDEEKFANALMRLFRDPQPVRLDIDKATAWRVIATIQLACRHPEFKGQTRDNVEDFARTMCASLTAHDPALRKLLDMGWDQTFDMPRG